MPKFEFCSDAMATTFRVFIQHPERRFAENAAHAVFREIDRIESMLTRFDPCSDVGQINLLHPGQAVHVSPETMDCLLTALWINRETAGAFDVALGNTVDQWTDAQRDPDLRVGPVDSLGTMQRLTLDPVGRRVGLADDGRGHITVDLGGIGKGFALDAAAGGLEELGAIHALLDAGTSTVLALGEWQIGIDSVPITVRDRAASGSGMEMQGSHVLDPRTGLPATGLDRAWVVAPSAAVADALSTAFMIMGARQAHRFAATHKGIEAILPLSTPVS